MTLILALISLNVTLVIVGWEVCKELRFIREYLRRISCELEKKK